MRTHRRVPQAAVLAIAALAATALLVAGCSAGSADSGAAEQQAMPAPMDMDGEVKQAEGAYSGADSAAGGAAEDATTASGSRLMIVSGSVTVVVKDPVKAVGTVVGLVEKVGGFVSGRQQQSSRGDTQGWATLTARVPAADLQDVIAGLDDVGRVDSSELSSTEVTAQVRDLDARIKALQLSIDRLTDLLARSGDLEDIVQAEQVLTDRQSQLEELQSQRAALADQVAMSTVEIRLVQDGTVAPPARSGFVGGLSGGWHALVTFLGGLVTVLGALLPWLAVAALVTVAAWPLVRRSRRRAAAKAAERAAHPAAAPPAYQYLRQPVPAAAPAGSAPAGPPPVAAPPAAPGTDDESSQE